MEPVFLASADGVGAVTAGVDQVFSLPVARARLPLSPVLSPVLSEGWHGLGCRKAGVLLALADPARPGTAGFAPGLAAVVAAVVAAAVLSRGNILLPCTCSDPIIPNQP